MNVAERASADPKFEVCQGKQPPWGCQLEAYDYVADRAFYALLMEQRTGKTAVVLNDAARRYDRGEIDALLVVAMPGTVHLNWVNDEVPAHLPARVPRRCLGWIAGKAHTRAAQAEQEALLHFKGLAILAVNGEALITPTFRRYLGRFLKARRVMAVGDETTLIMKTPGITRTKVMHAIRAQPTVKVRAILDGTPTGEGPLDLFSQYWFLDWSVLGHKSFWSYKTHFAEWEKGYDPRTGREFPRLKGYLNVPELHRRMMTCSYRALRKDWLDIPDKVYVPKHYFELSPEQRRVYDDLEAQYEAEFADGLRVTAANVLTRYLRLMQVTSNYWPAIDALKLCVCEGEGCEACDGVGAFEVTVPSRRIDPVHHPRLSTFREVIQLSDERTIVWARFRQDVDDALDCLLDLGRRPCRYDGAVSMTEKEHNKRAFQAGEFTDLVGSARSGGRGLKLPAGSIHYYSNEFPLLVRLQSEDRAEIVGNEVGTGVHDYVGLQTKDEDVVDALRSKQSLAAMILNEPDRKWI